MSSLADDLDDLRAAPTDPPPHTVSTGTWKVEVDKDSAEVETGAVERMLVSADDWNGVLRHFGLNPDEFCIVDDTVRMSSWQQSKRLENGDRDTVTLYSYRARFARVTDRLPAADVDDLARRVRKWKPLVRKTPGSGLGEPCTFYVGWADWQLGKSAGGGAAGTTQRVLDSIEQAARRVKELRRAGRNVESLAIANMGDPVEGCYGNYDSQLFTVELTKREQLNLVLDLWSVGLRALAPLFDDVQFISVLSNHSEWTRQTTGGKQVTSDSDNADGFLAETLRRVLHDRPDFSHVRWTIPHDEMTVLADLSGVTTAFAHGHKAPGSAKELEWLRGQSIRLMHEQRSVVQLWMTAHRHHLEAKDYGAWWRLQHPSLDSTPDSTDGSKWYTDTSGLWSTPGTMTCLVGQHEQAGARRFSDLQVL